MCSGSRALVSQPRKCSSGICLCLRLSVAHAFLASLQVPYLLNVALAITEYLPAFPPSPRPTFALLKKLDHCFASLLRGHDIRTGKPLPGFEHGTSKGMTRTDMVRCRSLIDETRSLAAVKMSGESDVDTSLFPEHEADMSTPAPLTNKRKVEDRSDEEGAFSQSTRSTPSPKRQKTESPTYEVDTPGIKQEDEDTPRAGSTGFLAAETASAAAGQFHWAVDEDSDEEHEGETDYVMTEPVDRTSPRLTPASGSDHEEPTADQREIHHAITDEDEDEELHMSVAKVYDKTIVWLGKTLGETLVDE